MDKKELLALIEKTEDIEKLLTASKDSLYPTLKTINRKSDFQLWKTELAHQLRMLKQEPLVVELLQLIDTGFKNGFTDEKDFVNLKAKLTVLSSHLDEYIDGEKDKMISQKLKKGTIIKTAFDEYVLIKQVGSGGNGRVYSAKNKDNESFAIKFVEQNISADKLKRFKNEINFCEQHSHKNIVVIHDRGYAFLDNKDYVFYVMPLYSETLKDKIKTGIPHKDIVNIFLGLIDGLSFAHKQGTIHRDIKPENIMFADGSIEPIICDFGIAHFAEEDMLTIIKTKENDRMANFQYAAPEQRKKGGKVCCQTDIYALALILNEMFTQEIPQAAGHKRIESVNPEYKYLDELFDKLFQQEPEARLYPEEAILTELKLLTERYKREEEKKKLQSIVYEVVKPEDFNPSIINMEYQNGSLLFTLDTAFSDEWFQILKNGSYSHSWTLGYDTNNLRKISKNSISLPIRGSESQETIKSLVANVKDWVKTVSKEYSDAAKRQAISEQKRLEEARLAEIARIEKEDALTQNLNSLLKDLL